MQSWIGMMILPTRSGFETSSAQFTFESSIGVLLSSIAALTFFAFALRYKLHSGARPDDDSVLEALTDMPLET